MTLTKIIAANRQELEEGKWYYCYENGVMTGITRNRMTRLQSFLDSATVRLLKGFLEEMGEDESPVWDENESQIEQDGYYIMSGISQERQRLRFLIQSALDELKK